MYEWFGINDKQPELSKLLTRDDVSRIVDAPNVFLSVQLWKKCFTLAINDELNKEE
jgi:hypothetical protein